MAFGTLRTLIYTFCVLQLLTTIERQIFDFLGYMWLPIVWNFFNIVFLIFCIFGVNQYKRSYVFTHVGWSILWLGWNAFVICFYLDLGSLDRNDDLLSFGTGSFSWWLANGYGCHPEYYHNASTFDLNEGKTGYFPLRPSQVYGCAVEYYYVEVIHASIQITLTVVVVALVLYFCYMLQTKAGQSQKSQVHGGKAPLYSIEYSPQVNDSQMSGTLMQETTLYANTTDSARAQMTPRRVKRRSHGRSSTRSAAHTKSSLNRNRRSSTRSLGHINIGSMRSSQKAVNPVTRLLDHPSNGGGPSGGARHALDSSTSDEFNKHSEEYGQINPAYESSRPNSLYSSSVNGATARGNDPQERPPSTLTSYSNFHGQRKPVKGPTVPHPTVLTQSAFNGPLSGSAPSQNPNMSFDDLPPPPSPIAGSPILSRQDLSTGQVPVPQQRNQSRRNEYVNMPMSSSGNNQERTLPPIPNHYSTEGNDTQTLRANDRLLPQPQQVNGYAHHNGGVRPKTSSLLFRKDPSFPAPPASTDEEYGFSQPVSQPDQTHYPQQNQPQQQQNQPQQQNHQQQQQRQRQLQQQPKKINIDYSQEMNGYGNSHGGNCKCYRCQRKLTAI